ncbi:prepilin-type N-terminal cleavage/methylation domain-containing protein [Macrococcoides goetzii]|nr:prepilin-type N-terminal cleavage/methylation domain-containing protein [Macrococcus goetzii]
MYKFIKTHSNHFVRSFKNQFSKNDGFTLIEMIVVKKTLNAL